MKIGEIVRAGIKAGKNNEAILVDVKAAHPDANTTAKTIAWYRSDEKKKGTDAPKVKRAAKSATSLTPVAPVLSTAEAFHYEAKKVKNFMGQDCPGYNCDLIRDGMKVAEVVQDGSGGMTMVHWVDYKEPKVEQTFWHHDGTQHTRMMTPEEAKLFGHILDLSYSVNFGNGPETSHHSEETFIDELVFVAKLRKQAERIKKDTDRITFKDGDKVYTLKSAESLPALKARIAREKGPQIVILNDLTVEEIVAILLANAE